MLRNSAASNPAGSRTVAAPRLSSMGGRVAPSAACMRACLGVGGRAAGVRSTGSIVATSLEPAAPYRGNHLRMTLALMPWLKAIPDTEAPGCRHRATTSRLNAGAYERRLTLLPCAANGTPTLVSACFMVDAIITPSTQIGKMGTRRAITVYLDTARLLVQVAPLIFADGTFALKGGTAINLSIRDMPRLSVDLDLVFPDRSLPREQALARIHGAIGAAAERLKAVAFKPAQLQLKAQATPSCWFAGRAVG